MLTTTFGNALVASDGPHRIQITAAQLAGMVVAEPINAGSLDPQIAQFGGVQIVIEPASVDSATPQGGAARQDREE